MTEFQLIEEQNPALGWVPPLASLLAAAWLAQSICDIPPPHSLLWRELIMLSVKYVLIVSLACAACMWCLSMVLRKDLIPAILPLAASAAWIVPATIFYLEKSAWTFAVVVVAAASVIPLARWLQDPAEDKQHGFVPALCASVLVEGAAASAMAGSLFIGACLAGVCSCLCAWLVSASDTDRSLRTTNRSAMFLLMALLTSGVGLSKYLRVSLFPYGASGDTNSNLNPSASGTHSGNQATFEVGGEYSGIVLLPEIDSNKILLIPPRAFGKSPMPSSRRDPLSIPFSGVYWIFKAKDKRLPKTAVSTRANAAETSFRATDRSPLRTEAHQNFSASIDPRCCRGIDIVIGNADRYPGSVSLELILVDTQSSKRESQSLGIREVRSAPRWRPGQDGGKYEESLSFPIPVEPSIRTFDEVTIRFHTKPLRASSSPRIAINQFVFVPRAH